MRSLIVVLVLLFTSFATASEFGELKKFTGEVSISRKFKKVKPEVGIKLKEKDVIKTKKNSTLDIYMEEDNNMHIAEKSRVTLKREKKKGKKDAVLLEFMAGAGRFKLKNLKGKEFFIKTPTAVAGVRGTDFVASYNPELGAKAFGITVITGEVAVGTNLDELTETMNSGISVKANEQIVISNSGVVGKVVKVPETQMKSLQNKYPVARSLKSENSSKTSEKETDQEKKKDKKDKEDKKNSDKSQSKDKNKNSETKNKDKQPAKKAQSEAKEDKKDNKKETQKEDETSSKKTDSKKTLKDQSSKDEPKTRKGSTEKSGKNSKVSEASTAKNSTQKEGDKDAKSEKPPETEKSNTKSVKDSSSEKPTESKSSVSSETKNETPTKVTADQSTEATEDTANTEEPTEEKEETTGTNDSTESNEDSTASNDSTETNENTTDAGESTEATNEPVNTSDSAAEVTPETTSVEVTPEVQAPEIEIDLGEDLSLSDLNEAIVDQAEIVNDVIQNEINDVIKETQQEIETIRLRIRLNIEE